MAKLTTKLTALLLLAAMLLSAVACSKTDDGKTDATTTAAPTDTTVGETEEPKLLPDLPDVKFDGKDFRFYQYRTNDTSPRYRDIWVEAADADPVNDAVYKRNSFVEEKYGVKIVLTEEEYQAHFRNIIKWTESNEDFAEAMIIMGHVVGFLSGSNVFYNLHDIDYLDLEKPWWNQDAVESFTLAGYLPFAVSDLTINDKSQTAAMFFNKKLKDDYQIEMDFYKLVDDGKWTMENMISAAKMSIEDLDADTIIDDDDRFGILTSDEPVYMFFHASGGRYVTKNAEGYPEYTFESEANYTAIKYYLEEIMYDEKMTRNNAWVPDAKSVVDMFEQNQGLFFIDFLGAANELRDMEADFGILPIPKYQESQEGYASSASVFQGALVSVPKITQETEMIGIILEALSAESKYELIPAFYQTVLKDKSSRDPDSERMIDIIINSMVFDVGDFYGIAGFQDIFLRITGHVYLYANKGYPQQTSDVASLYAQYEKKIDKAIEELVEIIDEWNA